MKFRTNVWLAVGLSVLVLGCSMAGGWGCGDARRQTVPPASDETKRQTIATQYAEYKRSFPEAPDLSVEQAVEMLSAGGVIVVDVRKKAELAVSHLPDAVAQDRFEQDIDQYRDKDVIVYCTIGYRSGKYVQTLREDGIRAHNLSGGILAWTHAGQPVVDDQGETKRLHVYGRKWDLAPAGYDTTW